MICYPPINAKIFLSGTGSDAHPVVDEINVPPQTTCEQQIVWELDEELIKRGFLFQEDGQSPASFEWVKAEKSDGGNFRPHHLCKKADRTKLCMEDIHSDDGSKGDWEYTLRIFIGKQPTIVSLPNKDSKYFSPTKSPIIHNR